MIIVSGDWHGDFSSINKLISRHKNIDMILQCGDFGWWPRFHNKTYLDQQGNIHTFDNYKLKNKDVKIFWCPGNHEDWESLQNLEDIEVMPNVYYMERGAVLTLPDKRNVLFMGGGLSIDRQDRIPRSGAFGWFWEETITQKDIEELPNENIDIIVSHTAPNEFIINDYHMDYEKDPSRDALSYLLKKYHPKLWYFGHMHQFQQGIYNNCKWTCLSAIGFDGRWWIELE